MFCPSFLVTYYVAVNFNFSIFPFLGDHSLQKIRPLKTKAQNKATNKKVSKFLSLLCAPPSEEA